jgi:hypothetical protein
LVRMLDKNPATRYSFSEILSDEYFKDFNYSGPTPSLPTIKIDDIEQIWERCVGNQQERQNTLTWFFNTCEILRTNYLTLASTYQLTDIFFYKLLLKPTEVEPHFIASACFTISAKIYEENFPDVLKAYMSTIEFHGIDSYDKYKEKVEKAERMVIKRLNGNLLWKMPQKTSLANIFSMYSQKDVYN